MVWMTTVGETGREPAWHLLGAPVRVLQLYGRESGSPPEQLDGRVLCLGDAPLALVGDDYQLVRHADFVAALDRTVRDRWPVMNVETLVGRDGARARVSWTIPRLNRRVAGADVTFRVVGRNSYDQSRALAVELGAVCGDVRLPVPESVRGESRRHVRSLDVADLLGVVLDVTDMADAAVMRWEEWATVAVSRDRLESFLRGRGRFPTSAVRDVSRRFAATTPTGGTAWSAYRAVAWWATHHVTVRRDSRLLERQEEIYRMADRFIEEVLDV